MKSPSFSTVLFHLHGLQFLTGMAILVLSGVGLAVYRPDPPEAAFETLVGMLGPWPYLIGAAFGAMVARRAWAKARRDLNRLRGAR